MKNLHLYKRRMYPFFLSLYVFLLYLIQPRQASQVILAGKKKKGHEVGVSPKEKCASRIHPLISNRFTHSPYSLQLETLHPETFSLSKRSQLKKKLLKCPINALICYSYFFRQDFVISNVT